MAGENTLTRSLSAQMRAEIEELAKRHGLPLTKCVVDAKGETVACSLRIGDKPPMQKTWTAPIAHQRDVMKRLAQHRQLLGLS